MDLYTDGIYAPFALEVITDVLLKATILLSAAWLATVLLRRASAAIRYGIWSLVLSGLLVMPLISVVLPAWKMNVPAPMLDASVPAASLPALEAFPASVPAPPMASSSPDAVEVNPVDAGEKPLLADSPTALPSGVSAHGLASAASDAVAVSPWRSWIAWGLVVWFVGALVLLVRLLVDILYVASITRQARRIPGGPHEPVLKRLTPAMQLRRPVRIRYSSRVSTPMMWGLWWPVVILPETAHTWSQERFRLVLLHELAHVKRWDYLTHLVTQLVWSFYWLNPLVWVAAHRVSLEQERACDDLVLKAGTKASTYAEHLLDLTRSLQRHGGLASTMAMARGSTLKERIRAILNKHLDRRALTPRAGVVSTLVVAGVLVPLAAVHLEKEHSRDDSEQVHQALEALEDPSAKVRQRAAWALGDLESPRAVETLIHHLDDHDPDVRSMAAWALGEIKDRRAVEPLIRMLVDVDPYVKEMGVRALGELEDHRAVKALAAVLDEDDAGLRAAAAWALGEISGAAAVDALAAVLHADPDVRTRKAAAEALRDSGSTQAILALIAAMGDESPVIRTTVVRALAAIGDRRAIVPLGAALRTDNNAEVRMLAAVALGTFADPLALGGLLVGLDDTHPGVREKSAWALGKIRDPRAVDALMRHLRDADPAVRAMAVWALDEIST